MLALLAQQQASVSGVSYETPETEALSDPWRWWSAETISAITQCPQASVEAAWPLIHAALDARGAASPASCAAAIGTIAIETASTFKPVREAFWMPESWRAANLRYYPWYGRGFIQLTWESNYQAASEAIGVDLLANPEEAMDPATAAEIFAWYWCVARPDIPRYADQRNWSMVRRMVQGGSDGLGRLISIAEQLLAEVNG